MKSRFALTLACAALAVVALAGCSSPAPAASSTSSGAAYPAASSAAGSSPSASSKASAPGTIASLDANVASSSLGQIIVAGNGFTVYYFNNDVANSGTSACSGGCATAWPPVLSKTASPVVTGITGKVATIPSGSGFQITVNGRPIYLHTSDKAAGDVTGQGIGMLWYVVAPNGDEIKG